jgi:hypothetical protein
VSCCQSSLPRSAPPSRSRCSVQFYPSGRAVLIGEASSLTPRSTTASQAREPDRYASARASLRPRRFILYRRSIGSTRYCISSTRHPISPFRTLGQTLDSVATAALRYPASLADRPELPVQAFATVFAHPCEICIPAQHAYDSNAVFQKLEDVAVFLKLSKSWKLEISAPLLPMRRICRSTSMGMGDSSCC